MYLIKLQNGGPGKGKRNPPLRLRLPNDVLYKNVAVNKINK